MRDVLQKQAGGANVAPSLRAAALVGLILVLPFAILEALNQTINRHNAPGLIVLFSLLWLLPTAFVVILAPLVRAARAGQSLTANPFTLWSRVALLALVASVWGAILTDQLPCFMGVPNCD